MPYLIRLSWETFRVLNYPWIAQGANPIREIKEGRSPKVTPRDSYYRCKIKLPKPDGVETRQLEPRDEAYGKRLHQVRGHWRVYRDEHGDFVKRTWIREHRRGDAKLGVVLKDYVLTGEGTSYAQRYILRPKRYVLRPNWRQRIINKHITTNGEREWTT